MASWLDELLGVPSRTQTQPGSAQFPWQAPAGQQVPQQLPPGAAQGAPLPNVRVPVWSPQTQTPRFEPRGQTFHSLGMLPWHHPQQQPAPWQGQQPAPWQGQQPTNWWNQPTPAQAQASMLDWLYGFGGMMGQPWMAPHRRWNPDPWAELTAHWEIAQWLRETGQEARPEHFGLDPSQVELTQFQQDLDAWLTQMDEWWQNQIANFRPPPPNWAPPQKPMQNILQVMQDFRLMDGMVGFPTTRSQAGPQYPWREPHLSHPGNRISVNPDGSYRFLVNSGPAAAGTGTPTGASRAMLHWLPRGTGWDHAQTEGTDQFYTFGVKFPRNYDGVRWSQFVQWHHEGESGGAPVSFFVRDDTIYASVMTRPNGTEADRVIVWQAPLDKERYYNFQVRLLHSSDPNKGKLQIWLDGKPVGEYTGATMYPGQRNYFGIGHYAHGELGGKNQLYLDMKDVGVYDVAALLTGIPGTGGQIHPGGTFETPGVFNPFESESTQENIFDDPSPTWNAWLDLINSQNIPDTPPPGPTPGGTGLDAGTAPIINHQPGTIPAGTAPIINHQPGTIPSGSYQTRFQSAINAVFSTLKQTSYGDLNWNPSTGTYIARCNTFVLMMLKSAAARAYDDMRKISGSSSPRAHSMWDIITNNKSQNIAKVTQASQLRNGDILAATYWYSHGWRPGSSANSGHVMMVVGTPKNLGGGVFQVRVADGASGRHSNDTREAGTNGVGMGDILIKVDSSGNMTHWAWSVSGNPSWRPANQHIVAGRPLG